MPNAKRVSADAIAARIWGDSLSGDELDALLPHVVNTLGRPVSKADIFDLELAILQDVAEGLIADVFNGDLILDELLTDQFLRDLHRQLYGDIWVWAGRWRSREVNIGVALELIAVELRTTMDNIRYRWVNTKDLTARELGIATHAEGVRVHPFTDGNGRATRLHADLVFIAAQDSPTHQYDWDVDKRRYIKLLRDFDRDRDVTALTAFIGIRRIED